MRKRKRTGQLDIGGKRLDNQRPNHEEFGFYPKENEQPIERLNMRVTELRFVFRNKIPRELLGPLW